MKVCLRNHYFLCQFIGNPDLLGNSINFRKMGLIAVVMKQIRSYQLSLPYEFVEIPLIQEKFAQICKDCPVDDQVLYQLSYEAEPREPRK
jgi:hypothetical protein